MENTNEILGLNSNDQFKRPNRTFSEDLKPSVLIIIKIVYSMFYLGFHHISLPSPTEWPTIWPTLMAWSTAAIFEALWLLKNILSDMVINVSYITHKYTTLYVYQKVIS